MSSRSKSPLRSLNFGRRLATEARQHLVLRLEPPRRPGPAFFEQTRPLPERWLTQNRRRGKGQVTDERVEGPDYLTVFTTMPRPPAKASTVGVSGPPSATAQTQSQSVSHLQHLKEEAEMQQLQMQQLQQVQHAQQYQLQQQAQMQLQQQQQEQLHQQQQQQHQLQYTQGMGAASGTLGQSATANNLVSVAVQAAANAANAAATAGGATAGGGYAFPRNSPEFACENVGERVKGKRRKYCPHEVTALVLGVQRYADDSCPWSSILRDPHLGHLFHGRSGVDLKDKWRTLIKTRPELAAYTENRKNHRKYRPFSATEERALLEGVKKYNGQRNVWSLILIDKELGPQFNDRSNVQLKDKFRTMRRAGATSSLLISGGGTVGVGVNAGTISRRTSAASTPTSDSAATTRTSAATSATTSRTLTPTSTAVLSAAVSAAVNGTSRAPTTVTSASQQAAALLVQNSNAASAMFADPNLYLAGSFSIPPHMSQAMSMPQMTTTQSRQQTVQAQAQAHAQAQAQAQAHAQAQAIANAQARAAQVQLEAQMQQMHGGQQVTIKQQYQALNAQNRFSAGISGYQLVGNQIVPQQAIYYPTSQIAHCKQLSDLPATAEVAVDKFRSAEWNITSMKVGELASSSVEDLLLQEANANSAAASASAGGDVSSTEHNTRTI
ncbi:hypothetical protein PF004_g23606 [Phytophthora fragariae]|uniref:Myb-like domain-containing protein n=1 Tax=Phytophthora fragariae TaxID=53985 RepID=A0A6G0MWL6_9STRA|nr:hypothetical protein PF004_g23606 [Phytophthora fragariae]